MKMSSRALREYVNRHLGSTSILAVLGVVLDAHVTATPLHPALQARIDEVLEALGLAGITEGVSAVELKQILAEIRLNMLPGRKASPSPNAFLGTHTETAILQAGGEVSAGFADALTRTIVPRLNGLSQRLGSPDGSFLDVGVAWLGCRSRWHFYGRR
jgi:crotonobetainyl-CoA:carnitine CoA-transferase CaiB-like acyl-CoA transferase